MAKGLDVSISDKNNSAVEEKSIDKLIQWLMWKEATTYCILQGSEQKRLLFAYMKQL